MKNNHNYTQADILGDLTPREKIIVKINADPDTKRIFSKFDHAQKEKILAFLSGERGLEVLLDSFFKKLFDPLMNKDRVCSLLSALLGRKVEDYTIMPREGELMYEKGSLVIMDILVRLEDQSLVDVEMQKIGYCFPSQRSTCYASDLIMRQYNALRAEYGKKFNYKMIHPVNLFVIIESPDNEFKDSGHYIHKRQVSYSSGIMLPETVNITYLTLDSFKKAVQNITEPLEKWLAFFTCKEPDEIIRFVNRFPEFLPLYHEISEFRKDPKEAIYMYSEALAVLDHNTELYMIEEKQQEIDALQIKLKSTDREKQTLAQEKQTLTQEKQTLTQEKQTLAQENISLAEKLAEYESKYGKL